MSDDPAPTPVTADRPDSVLNTTGLDHVTLIGSNEADTVEFYRDVLGMPLVLRQPNLDDPESTHLFFDAGDGRIVTFFVTPGRESDPGPLRHGIGSVHHLAFRVDPERFVEVKESLSEHGQRFNEFDRGVFHSLYTRDHNGLTIELSTDKYDIPDDRRAEVLATAQRIREDEGAEFAREEDLEAALTELDIAVEKHELPEADTGTGV